MIGWLALLDLECEVFKKGMRKEGESPGEGIKGLAGRKNQELPGGGGPGRLLLT